MVGFVAAASLSSLVKERGKMALRRASRNSKAGPFAHTLIKCKAL